MNSRPIRLLERYTYLFIYVCRVFLATLMMLGLIGFLRVWLFRKDRQYMTVDSLKFLVRGHNLISKLVDISMILECVHFKHYTDWSFFKIGHRDTVIDIGAHIGSFSIFAASQAVSGTVYAFEPSPNNLAFLKENINLNKVGNIRASNKAVAGRQGRLRIFLHGTNSAENGIYCRGQKYILADSVSLKQVLEENHIHKCDFLKIDCEGSEYDILLSSNGSTLSKIRRIALEYHEPDYLGIKESNYSVQSLVKHLEKYGFKTKMIRTNSYQGRLFAWR